MSGSIRLYGSTSGFVELQAPAVAADNTVNIGDIPQFSGVPSDGDLMRYDAGTGEWALVSQLDAAQVPNLDASKIATGTVNTARLPAGYLYAGQVRFTSNGTFSKANPLGTGDIGLRAIRVRMVGGGGGGGSARDVESAGGGGGAGGYAEAFITDIAGLPSSVTVTRGAGGAGGTTAAGQAGGQSSFDALVVATGGETTSNASAQGGRGGAGGVGTAGDLLIQGGDGGAGSWTAAAGRASGGTGGSSMLGGGGRGAPTSVQEAGSPGGNYGGGGGGAVRTTTNQDGGAGANGIVIVDCFV